MSNQQPNVWQTAGRGKPSNTTSRTPQNRSGNASPQQNPPSQPPKAQQPANNVWAQRSTSSGNTNSNGAARSDAGPQEEAHVSANGFNAAAVKTFLARDTAPAAYKPAEAAGAGKGSGPAWGAKANHMANNQPFFVQLAKQVATFEGGG